jgi:long-chain fatty acid transport protein
VAQPYSSGTMAFKMDLNEKVSFALGIDSPYGANTRYSTLDFGAHLESTSLTALGRYKFSPSMSVHAGLYQASLEGGFNPSTGLPAGREIAVAKSSDTGYIVGAAFERPEIAARVALTYFSGTDHVDSKSNSSVNAPQAVNLDFQTGIAANTLLFGGIRWADWSKTVIKVGGNTLVTYADDSMTYNLGIGRKFNDNWSGALTLGYEESKGGVASALAPTDGYLSVGLGATYTRDNMKITAGVRSINLGDATTSGLSANDWKGNSALAVGAKISFSF